MSTSSKKNIILKSSNGMHFMVEEAVALQSQTIAQTIEDGLVGNGILIPNVTGEILSLVIEYCQKHVAVVDDSSSYSLEDLKHWDAEFMNDLDKSTLLHMMMAADFLNVKSLVDLTCQTIVDVMLTGKTVEELRKTFNLENEHIRARSTGSQKISMGF
ncbi:unnamed protein product [Thlaspi arvense]|uniref:SKP1-like protein n=1 Tax=Thlaspi arvense TaxID=13288 RepID=A0AAU9R8Q6_THLAR|nr:unnamed protein product [Thlaspi arvense]